MEMVNFKTWNESHCLWEFNHLRRFGVPCELILTADKFPVCAFI
jgi:hypothetical protein